MAENLRIARMFVTMANILEVMGNNPFKIRAYRRAAQSVEGLPRSVRGMTTEELLAIPGIGAAIAGKIEEYLQTGSMHTFDRLKGEIPQGLLNLLTVPGLNPKTAKLIFEKLHVANLEELEAAAREHRLEGIPGIRKKDKENILKGIDALKERTQ